MARKIDTKNANKMYRVVYGNKINAKSKASELKTYIKKAADIINEAYPTMNKASAMDVKRAISKYGKGKVRDSVSSATNKNIKQLRNMAIDYQEILKGDTNSDVAKMLKELQTRKAYRSFIVSDKGFYVTRKQYDDMWKVFNEMETYFKQEYGSEIIRNMQDMKEEGFSYSTFGDMVRMYYTNTIKLSTKTGKIRFYNIAKKYKVGDLRWEDILDGKTKTEKIINMVRKSGDLEELIKEYVKGTK